MKITRVRTRSDVFRAAARAWNAGRPHRALEIMTDAGCRELWPVFQRVALRRARERYHRRITIASSL